MKKISSGLALLLLTATTVSAQTETTNPAPKWTIHSFGINYGSVHDRYQDMSLEMMYDFTKNPALLDRNLTGLEENLYRVSTGYRLGIQTTFRAQRPNSSIGHEIRLGASWSGREPLISFSDPYNEEQMQPRDEIIYCNVVNEYGLDGAYLLRKSFGNGWFSVYSGAGLSLGTSVNSQLVVMERSYDENGMMTSDTDSFYGAKSSLFSRVQVPIGIQFTLLQKVNFLAETRFGVGMQSMFGGRSYFMPLATGFRLGLSYNL